MMMKKVQYLRMMALCGTTSLALCACDPGVQEEEPDAGPSQSSSSALGSTWGGSSSCVSDVTTASSARLSSSSSTCDGSQSCMPAVTSSSQYQGTTSSGCFTPNFPSDCSQVSQFQCGVEYQCDGNRITIRWHHHICDEYFGPPVYYQCSFTCPEACRLDGWPRNGDDLVQNYCVSVSSVSGEQPQSSSWDSSSGQSSNMHIDEWQGP